MPPEPFNLEELNVSVPNIKYDVDEFFYSLLKDRYANLEKCIEICKQHDRYLEDGKITSKLISMKLCANEEEAG